MVISWRRSKARKKLVEGDVRIVIEILLWENEARKYDWLKEKSV